MGENNGIIKSSQNQVLHVSLDHHDDDHVLSDQSNPKLYDDDGRPKRTGSVWTASAHVITAVIGSGVLSLAWATAQLGWIAGPCVLLMFAFVSYYMSSLLADCYRFGDPISGKRNYTYMDVVRSNLGGTKVKICGVVQYLNLFGICIGYTIGTSISMMAINRSNCFHKNGEKKACRSSSNPYMIMFGIIEIVLSQIPDLSQAWWLSTIAAVMSFTYSTIGLGLAIARIAANGTIKGSLTGVSAGAVSQSERIWRSFQAIGDMSFSYCYSFILIEIQDTLKSPPSEATTMKRANLISTTVTTTFYMLCGCLGYAAVGNLAPGNLLTGFAFHNPFWLLDIANIAIVVHLLGAYQVFSQPIFAFAEKWVSKNCNTSKFITKQIKISVPGLGSFNLTLFRLVFRTSFVTLTTVVSMMLPFFNDILGIMGAIGFWPLTVYFPVEMYMVHKKIEKWSTKWIFLRLLSLFCLIVTVVAGVGSVAGVILELKVFRPFHTSY
ncbi:amino acid permease 4 [Ziziphus jujuba]|uniref:Amino acid permease 4 n=1 Tax=Ziziphus jujuba TaxID=326968 RepID=A0ABM3IS46_ZIZJJ|nr:amino acid permease 4 [Ziziphus jujuba]